MRELRLGTRGSQLALWQANAVAARLAEHDVRCRIEIIKTSGDRLQEAPLSEIGGKRLFVKEIEDALLRQEIDLAVHSSKDMPAVLPEGLTIAAVLPREDPLDAMVLPATIRLQTNTGSARLKPDTTAVGDATTAPVVSGFSRTPDPVMSGFSRTTALDDLIATLGPSPRIGTGSVRRIAQLTGVIAGARFVPIRGNLDTRLRKLDAREYDAIVLAAAGLNRLGLASRISMTIPASACMPAPGQGIVAVEIREGDDEVGRALSMLNDGAAAAALDAERSVVAGLGGGCQTPIGALAVPVEGEQLQIAAVVISLDGSREVRAGVRGPRTDAAAIGARAAEQLLAGGARAILDEALERNSNATMRPAAMTEE